MPRAASSLSAQAAVRDAARFAWLLFFVSALLSRPAAALDPALEMTQYGHRSWSARDGDFQGNLLGIGQSADGYLWLGTGFGLLRFDGARFVGWEPPPGSPELPGMPIQHLLGARDGSLWIGGNGLARLEDGVLIRYSEYDGCFVQSMVEDQGGKVWVSCLRRPTGRLCAFDEAGMECFGEDGRFGEWARGLYEDSRGRLWVGSPGKIWRFRPGPPQAFPQPAVVSVAISFAESDSGDLLVANGRALQRMADGTLEKLDLGDGNEVVGPNALLRDRDGGLWIGTDSSGLYHLAGGRLDRFSRQDGLSSDNVQKIFEDREGNVWVTTVSGLDQFRALALPKLTTRQGLASDNISAVLPARDGGLWVSTAGGLNYRSPTGAIERVDRDLPDPGMLSLFEDRRGRLWISTLLRNVGLLMLDKGRFSPFPLPVYNVFQLAEDGEGRVWFSAREQGLARVDLDGRLVENYSWNTLGNRAALSIAPDPRGGIWLGFNRGGVAYVEKGVAIEQFEAAQGLGEGQVRDLRLSPSGALWAATQGGLTRIGPAVPGGRRTVATLGARNGLPCDTVHWMRESSGFAWIYLACGLAYVAREELAAWEDDPTRQVVIAGLLDQTDGAENVIYNGYYTPSVVQMADGRFYFATANGLAMLDPQKLYRNALPPPVHVEQVVADGIAHRADRPLGLPPRVRDLQIDYTAPSFVAPDQLRFRYRLTGYDEDWQEPGNRRQAFYRELPPGSYRFEVQACNDVGLWNTAGAALDFEILPAYYQTGWFRLLALLALLGLGFLIYRWRVGMVTERLVWQFEERLAERTRIANELHDTLLQGFISASLQLAIAFARLPADLPERKRLDEVLALMRRVVDEGRDAVRGLRAESAESDDLERAFGRVPDELGIDREVSVRVSAEGKVPPLRAPVRDEVYRIGREALVNALRHSGADRIAVELRYRAKGFGLTVEDDGMGIEAGILAAGKEGHWGLPGMRERAARLGARFVAASQPGQGTRIVLEVPAAVAYQRPPGRPRWYSR